MCAHLSRINESVSAHPGWVSLQQFKSAGSCSGLVKLGLVVDPGCPNPSFMQQAHGEEHLLSPSHILFCAPFYGCCMAASPMTLAGFAWDFVSCHTSHFLSGFIVCFCCISCRVSSFGLTLLFLLLLLLVLFGALPSLAYGPSVVLTEGLMCLSSCLSPLSVIKLVRLSSVLAIG